jgi:predicted lipid-binding transport protein (Tim44 family)
MIITAYNQGDTERLRPLLSPEVYDNFVEAMANRDRARQKREASLVGIENAEIVEAYLESRTAHVTVKFVSDQVNATRAADGTIVDGDPNTVTSVTDFWTFARDTRNRDPNWILVATGTPD